jgi:hypothetical protein
MNAYGLNASSHDDEPPKHIEDDIERLVDYYRSFGWVDLGQLNGTRTLRKKDANGLYVAIWRQPGDNGRVVSEEY